MIDDPVYTARIRIERREGPVREAYLPATSEPVVFGVHSEIAEHYGLEEGSYTPHATTIDYLAAATGG